MHYHAYNVLSVSRGSGEDTGAALDPEVPCREISASSADSAVERSSRSGLSLRWARKQSQSLGGDGERRDGGRGPLGLRLLHSSPEPLIDLIFVHGLRGGSVKTWRKGNDPRNFWPQSWLPLEPGLRNANIHSFGYESDWASTKSSVLNVHDFGQSLLEEMRNSPSLRDNGNGPIFLIGHSMGGLVIKKAYVLSKDVPEFQQRIRAIFFLATPHRGSDYAALLNNILTISGFLSSRQYVNDLTTGSTSAYLINEDFGKCASDLKVFSFYETLRMSIGIFSTIIVDKTSAVLGPGFRNERIQYLNANHRDVCKFDDPDDPNYITFKNALISATHHALQEVIKTKSIEFRKHMSLLKSFLRMSDSPEQFHQRTEGSCTWIDDREDFQEWRDSIGVAPQASIEDTDSNKNLSIFWVYANPGTGKTFLASHVADELAQFQLECASCFCQVGNESSNLGYLLRSLAYQMASSNASVRETLMDLCHEEFLLGLDDAGTFWNKIFKKGVLQARIRTPQYWIIDGIDECSKYAVFFSLIRGTQITFPLRIFITSRKISDMQRICRSLEPMASISSMEIQKEDSLKDIEYYIQSRTKSSPADTMGAFAQEDLAGKLLRRSNACFLWVRLVLDELEEVYSRDSMAKALNSIPEGMVPYYERTVRSMAQKKERHISSAVLVWVVASLRKLTIQELACALELDVKAVLPNAKSAVEGLCGQLVSVDDNSGTIELVHSTAHEFLLSEPAAPFTVVKPQAHERIVLTCLKILCSAELQPPRSQRQLSIQRPKTRKPSALLDYAIHQFSENLYLASSENDELLIQLDRFFRTNILSWIELIARQGSLHPLIRLSKNLKSYLDRRAKYISPLGAEVQNLDSWSTDLSRLATKLGPALLENPDSIYFLIPPLCPSGSAIHQRFAKRLDGLAIVGHVESTWDDCTASVGLGEDSIATAASSGQGLISVGMLSGSIELFDSHSFQKIAVLQANAPVDLVHPMDKGIAACTTKSVLLMTREGQVLWKTRLRFRCILLTSTDQAVVAASECGHVFQWDISTGALLESQLFVYKKPDDDGSGYDRIKAPHVASISADTDMIALGYIAGTVCIFDISSGGLVCWARDDQIRSMSALLFNPNPNINLLLVIFEDHGLALYDAFSGELVSMRGRPSTTGVLSACCSSEGRTLATMDTLGVLRIWDFEALNLLYHVSTPTGFFSILNFTPDASEIVDVFDSGMRLWGPGVLVRKTNEEDYSISEEATNLPPIEGEYELSRASKITALCVHPVLPMVFVGKQDGQVTAFDTRTGTRTAVLYTHAHGAGVARLTVNKNNDLASSDHHCVLQVWNLGSGQLPTLDNKSLRFTAYSASRIRQICFSANGELLIVGTEQFDRVYSTADGSCLRTIDFKPEERGIWRWLEDPTAEQGDTFCLLSSHALSKCYTLTKYGRALRRVEDSVIQLETPAGNSTEAIGIDSATICPSTKTLIISVRHESGCVLSSDTFLFDLSKGNLPSHLDSASYSMSLSLSPLSNDTARHCKQFLGVDSHTKRFVFLHVNWWICSADLASLAQREFTQHFFVPREYTSAANEILAVRSADNGIVFGHNGKLTIVKNGFNFGRTRTFT